MCQKRGINMTEMAGLIASLSARSHTPSSLVIAACHLGIALGPLLYFGGICKYLSSCQVHL